MYLRELAIDCRSADPEGRTVLATLSTEQPVKRGPDHEVLVHTPAAVNMERASKGLPLLVAHDHRAPVGVVEKISIVGSELKGLLRFGRNAKAEEVFRDVLDGVLRHLSVGYSIEATEEIPGGFRATRWTPHEVSVVAVPADHRAEIGRSYTMDTTNNGASRRERRESREAEEMRAAAAEDRGRLLDLAERNGLRREAEDLIARGHSDIRAALLEIMARRDEGGPGSFNRTGSTFLMEPESSRGMVSAMVDGLALRVGIKTDNPDARQFAGRSLVDLARDCLGRRGVAIGSRPVEIFERAMNSGDFPLVLSGLSNKILQNMREVDPASHTAWVKFTTTPNFKANSRPALSSAPSLLETSENAEFTNGALAERGKSFSAKKYGRIIRLSREAMVNDDLGAFVVAAQGFAQAALRLEADLVYAQLTTNPAMGDGVALFHADHGNLITGATTAFDATNALSALGAARAKMRLQKDPAGHGYLDVKPAFLILPVAMETLAESIIASLTRADGANSGVINPAWVRALTVVTDPRLDAHNAAYWYLSANHQQVDTVEIAHLEGTTAGFSTTEEVDFATGSIAIRGTWEGAVAAIDWAGLLRSNGA